MLVVYFVFLLIAVGIIYAGLQIYKGNSAYFQLLYGQLLSKKDKDNYIKLHHRALGLLYIGIGIIVVIILTFFQFKH
ncbi:MAG: hypothetical protein LKJ51_02210 [Limosilactobacillus sp.]|uniref:hypothetical protein n=1 Tax=Limosilactobacillus sp. TaxID=2773925 RepID=UPI0025C6F3F6|nr:hypothetical protein [Limosilactobacillus sp.]MCI1974720.1 hypothetical protein [Limosilactobacillus sp.]MCI2030500.1 hypothetical protein [Limosilactobacillus sp.]